MSTFFILKKRGNILILMYEILSNTIHMKTEPIPYDAIVVSQKAGIELANKLSVILNKTSNETKDENGKPIMGSENGLIPYTGFISKSPEFYSVVKTTGLIVSKYEKLKKK